MSQQIYNELFGVKGYSFVLHYEKAIEAKEQFTIELFEHIISEFEKEELCKYEISTQHVEILEGLAFNANKLKQAHKNNIVKQGIYWSQAVQFENIYNLMKISLDSQAV